MRVQWVRSTSIEYKIYLILNMKQIKNTECVYVYIKNNKNRQNDLPNVLKNTKNNQQNGLNDEQN